MITSLIFVLDFGLGSARSALGADLLDGLAKPHEGRSRRATSTMRVGENRRGPGERKIDPRAEPRGDRDERKLPNLDRVFAEARAFTNATDHGVGEVSAQPLEFYPVPQLFYAPSKPEGAWVELSFEVAKKEPPRLLLQGTRAADYGRYQAFLNGVKIGGVLDFYGAKLAAEEFRLLDFWPDPGKYALRLEGVGRHPASAGHYLGVESVRLRERRPRVATMGHDRDRDWRKDPVLYA